MGRVPAGWENAFMSWLTGTLVCLSLSPFISQSVRPRQQTILGVWIALAAVRSIGLGIEGALYAPATAQYAPMSVAARILVDLLFAWLSVQLLGQGRPANNEDLGAGKGPWGWIWRILLIGLAYFVFYFFFGSINALAYTLPFYRDNPQYGLAVPPMKVILIAELIRGPLFAIGAFLLSRLVDSPRRQLALWLGIALYAIGGAAPFIETTFRTMPLGFNLATLTELFFQNFLTGVVAAYLLRGRKNTLSPAASQSQG
jgi:hypothetical protein